MLTRAIVCGWQNYNEIKGFFYSTLLRGIQQFIIYLYAKNICTEVFYVQNNYGQLCSISNVKNKTKQEALAFPSATYIHT